MNKCHSNTELSSHEGTRRQFNGGKADIKLGIDVHQDFYVVVMQEGGSNLKPPQRFQKEAFLYWRPSSPAPEPKCMRYMKRADLGLDCSAISLRSGSIATWSARRSWTSKTGE